MAKKIAYIITLIGLLLVINSLVGSIFDLLSKQNVLISAQKRLDLEKAQNQKLKAQYAQAQTPEFIESQARNKLFLVKPGEQSVIIPDSLLPTTKTAKPIKSFSNWQQWLELFF